MSMRTLSDYFGDAFFAVINTLVRDYAFEIFQTTARYIRGSYVNGIGFMDEDGYLRLLKEVVKEFVKKYEDGLITDLFVEEFENICNDEKACDDIINDNRQGYIDYAVYCAKKSYNIDESSKCDIAFALLLTGFSADVIPEYLYEGIENKYDVIDEITNCL